MSIAVPAATRRRTDWLRRLGLVGFTFFFVKGLVWLGIVWFASGLV